MQAEDTAAVVAERWSMILSNISVILPQCTSDDSLPHVNAIAELLLSTLIDSRSHLHRCLVVICVD